MNHTFSVVRRHWKPLLGLNCVVLAATAYAATVYAEKSSPPVWEAEAQLNLPAKEGNLNADLGTLGSIRDSSIGFSNAVNPLVVQSEIITSDSVLERVLEVDPENEDYSKLSSYRGLFSAEPQEQTTMISLSAEGSSPELAIERLNNLVDAYQQRLNELRQQDASVREQFAQGELEQSHQNLLQAQNQLNEFQRSTGLVNVDVQTGELIESINELKTRHAQILADAQANETEAKMAAAFLQITPQQAMNSLRLAENVEYQAVREQLSQTEIALAEARSRYTNENPKIQSLSLERQELQEQLNQQVAKAIPGVAVTSVDATLGGSGADSRIGMITDLIRTQITAQGLQQQASQIQNRVEQLSSELAFVSKNKAQLTELQRKYDIAEGIYKGITAQVSQSKINTFDSYPNVQLVDGPTLDPEPTEPNRKLVILGGILAAAFGSMSILFFLESRKPLLSPKDLQQVEFPVLGRVSRLKQPHLRWELDAEAETEFQRLASALSFLQLENRRLMVTSATFSEGKTTVTLGVAIALAKLGFRVLVVDGDFRQAEMSRRLGYTKIDPEDNTSLVSVYPGLDLMPALIMPTDRICEFTREKFNQRLSTAQQTGRYDYVLVDSAPVSLVSETPLMSAAAQNVLFVVRPGTSDRYSVIDSLDQLQRHSAQVKGLIVNGVESRTEGYRYGHKEVLEAEA
ncbi:MAG: GumC family protein [Cyanophyceae cyanobacterium]